MYLNLFLFAHTQNDYYNSFNININGVADAEWLMRMTKLYFSIKNRTCLFQNMVALCGGASAPPFFRFILLRACCFVFSWCVLFFSLLFSSCRARRSAKRYCTDTANGKTRNAQNGFVTAATTSCIFASFLTDSLFVFFF